jgi:hypothetical protein
MNEQGFWRERTAVVKMRRHAALQFVIHHGRSQFDGRDVYKVLTP